MTRDRDVIVVGGGISGMAAACELARSGLSVVILEARNRLGGRIFSRPYSHDLAIELGAEFIHGRPAEIVDPLSAHGIEIDEVRGEPWCSEDEHLGPCNFFSQVDAILGRMDDSRADESFTQFLQRRFPNPPNDSDLERAKQHAIGYVSGFNAADPELVGVHWLVEEMRAEEKSRGDRAFRAVRGYQSLIDIFHGELQKHQVAIQTEAIVESVSWTPGRTEATVHSHDEERKFAAPRALVTLPLAVLQAKAGDIGGVRFVPSLPRQKLDALSKLEMGKVLRVVLQFDRRFWDDVRVDGNRTLSDMSFLFSQDRLFPTWWTTMPWRLPIITGWAPFRGAEKLSNLSAPEVMQEALSALGRLLRLDPQLLESWLQGVYYHDWQSDPFSRGAYSYGKVGCRGAQQALGAPLENTLFFAGEATDTTGNNGTVHGAIASGYRAAKEIMERIA